MKFEIPKSLRQLAQEEQDEFVPVRQYGFDIWFDNGELKLHVSHGHLVLLVQQVLKLNPSEEFSFQIALDNLEAIASWQKEHFSTSAAQLLAILRREVLLSDTAMRKRVEQGDVLFGELELIYHSNLPVSVDAGDDSFGGLVRSATLQHSLFGGAYYTIKIEVIAVNEAGAPARYVTEVRLAPWEGIRNVSALRVRPLTDAVKARLAVQGEAFRRYAIGVQFNAYSGVIAVPGFFGSQLFRADGRVIVDNRSLQYSEPSLAQSLYRGLRRVEDDADNDDDAPASESGDLELTDDVLWRCWFQVPAYSLKVHRWGVARVDAMSTIDFRKDAFDMLVMDSDYKHMVKSLVEHSKDSFTDVIDGKSGGIIFLLHGDPGVGKTLTAEAVAEVLERPLYSAAVGDLGTHPEDLETNLRKILDMVQRWNAVLLLDEADIFLEARNEHDIHRNAMVGVFLRLLEYHTGVLFLTTNRVKNFDPAFHSRISVAIHYPNLTPETREQITTNLFEKAQITADAARFRDRNLNGRQVKNVLRIAQTLARAEGVAVEDRHLDKVARMTSDFADFLKK